MSNYCIYVIESKLPRERTFYPWVKETFERKREALQRAKELQEKFAVVGRKFRVKDYWDQRPW